MKRHQFRRLMRALRGIAQSLAGLDRRPVSTRIEIGELKMAKHQLNRASGSKRMGLAAGPNVTFPELAKAGAVLVALDAGGNVVPAGIDPTKTVVAWSSSDSSVIGVTVPDPADTTKAILASTGKVGSGVKITAMLTNNDGRTPLPPAVSDAIDCPPGPAATAAIEIGTPA
jgi:hypothetical protein